MSSITYRMTITDVFEHRPESAILLGVVEQGQVSVGDIVLVKAGNEEVRVTVTGIEIFGAVINTAIAGQEIGLRVKGVDPSLIAAGSVVKAANSN